MAPPNYYSKKELTTIGVGGFALVDEFYGSGGRKGRITQPNYGHAAAYKATSRQLPPPPAFNHSAASASSSNGYSRRHQQGYSYRYSPTESVVCWTTPEVATVTETTTTVIRRYEAVTLHDGEMLMDNFNYNY